MAENKDGYNILIGVTASVAAIKLPELIKELQKILMDSIRIDIRVVTTNNALQFFQLGPEHNSVRVYRDVDEWNDWKKIGDPVLHIELRRWADILLIAPCDANTLAKLASGLCDNLLTCVVRAWDLSKPLLFCPAMNTLMWNHPITMKHLAVLKEFGYVEVPPVYKRLACGDEGFGAMADVRHIASAVSDFLTKPRKM